MHARDTDEKQTRTSRQQTHILSLNPEEIAQTYLHTRAAKDTQLEAPLVISCTINELDQLAPHTRFKTTTGQLLGPLDVLERLSTKHTWIAAHDVTSGKVEQLVRVDRFASPAQKIASMLRDSTCAWPGCGQPAALTQVHHIKAWSHGGTTDTGNLCLLCHHHHAINDDSRQNDWFIDIDPDGRIFARHPDGRFTTDDTPIAQASNAAQLYAHWATEHPDEPLISWERNSGDVSALDTDHRTTSSDPQARKVA